VRSPRELAIDLFEDARAWSEEGEKIAAWRIFVLTYFAYAGLRHIFASPPEDYSDWFKGITLVFHEMGHILFLPFGRTMTVLGGSLNQLIVPIAAGAYLLIKQRDYFGAVFAKAWLALSLWDLAVYVGDAASENLPLVSMGSGEPHHDWATLLTQWNLLNHDGQIAAGIRVVAVITWLGALAFGTWLCILMLRAKPPPWRGSE